MIRRITPSAITTVGLAAAVLSLIGAMLGEPILAAILLLIYMLLDLVDGLAARLLGVQSQFGQQLDSLADMVGAGVVPVVLLVNAVATPQVAALGFTAAAGVIWVCAVAIRLARFNLQRPQPQKTEIRGLPAPPAAVYLVLVVLARPLGGAIGLAPPELLVLVAAIAALMVSRIRQPPVHLLGQRRVLVAAALVIAVGSVAVFGVDAALALLTAGFAVAPLRALGTSTIRLWRAFVERFGSTA